MMAMERALLSVLLSVSIIVGCFAQSTYYITPTPDTPCPTDQEPCHTLSEYAASGYFNNLPMNATMKFLPGNHTLETMITLANLTSLAVLGDSSSLVGVTSRIVCTRPAGFAFTDITELYINALAFISCGNNNVGSLYIRSVAQSYISMCTFDSNYTTNWFASFGGAIALADGNLSLAGNTLRNNYAFYGGAIAVLQDGNLSLSRNTFLNSSAFKGGAIYIEYGYLYLTANTLDSNSAEYGGAIHAYHGTLDLTNNTFQSNFAYQEGTMGIEYGYLHLTGNILHNNSAEYGGAIHAYYGTLDLTNNTFQSNSANQGGAIYLANGTFSVTANAFQNNFAKYGGAIATSHGTINLTTNRFQSNFAHQGGAVDILFGHLSLTWNTFHTNSVEHAGGALQAYHGTLNLATNTFVHNSAGQGGAIDTKSGKFKVINNTFLNNSAAAGGAIIATDATLDLTANTFQSNRAYEGGAMQVEYGTLQLADNTFQNNIAEDGGGAITVYHGYVKLAIMNTFQNNYASHGGAVAVMSGTLNLTTSIFQGNIADEGGAIRTESGTLTLKYDTFRNNSAKRSGGAIAAVGGTLNLNMNTFQSNTANEGGAISANNGIANLTTNTFQNNNASYGGAVGTSNCTGNLTRNTFQSNHAHYGGAIGDIGGTHSLLRNAFQNNSANLGGAITAMNDTVSLQGSAFWGNFAISGGTIHAILSALKLIGNSFHNNIAILNGGALSVYASIVNLTMSTLQENNTSSTPGHEVTTALDYRLIVERVAFDSNSATYGGGLYLHNTTVRGNMVFSKNSAVEGGAIYADKGTFILNSTTTVVKNDARYGGGLLLSRYSRLYLLPDTTVRFINNTASETGGAISVKSIDLIDHCITGPTINYTYIYESDCFFQVELNNTQPWPHVVKNPTALQQLVQHFNISMYFENNSAIYAGGDLYGGSVDFCSLDSIENDQNYYDYLYSGVVFDNITSSESTMDLTSESLTFCVCQEAPLTHCTGSHYLQSVYPGGTVDVPLAAFGQRDQPTIATVHAVDLSEGMVLTNLEYSQSITKGCNTLRYTIYSLAVGTTQEMTLFADGPCSLHKTINVTLDILRCPPGFQLPQNESSCVCAQRLQKYTSRCIVDNETVLRQSNAEFWVGYNQDQGLILHSHCPFDYCTLEEAYLKVTDSDTQCNNNRSGLLCGKCNDNLSLVLGSSRCLQCSNPYLSLTAAFALAGIALVLLLLLLRLTVAAGTTNGLILYANIITMNSATLFRPKTTNVLTVFIAWLNLDLGIETCLYNGMDAYVKTWLQFAFPIYVWCLVIAVIVCCRYSLRLVKLLGRNPIAVLATLFLLSYAKLLRTAIAALSYTTLEYPNSQSAVWLHDGNIEYLSSKHIPLFVAAIGCLILLFLPYTALLIAAQWLQARSNWRVFSWMNNRYVVSFLDAYHAPYSTKRRYWFGLMLLLRFVLFLIFAVNVLGDPRINLLSVGSALIFVIPAILTGTGTYRSLCLGLLELSFLINLAILVLATLYIYPNEANQNAVTFTSISIAFATFSGIVIYHTIQQIKATQLWRKLFVRRDFVPVPLDEEGEIEEDPPERVYVSGCAPTQTVVDLRELRKECEATNIQEPCKAAEPHSGADVQEPSMEIHPQDPRETTELLEPVKPLELQEEPLDLIGLREPLEPIELQETLEPADLQALLESNEVAQLQGSAEQLETAELQEQVESAEPLGATEVQELRELIQLREPLLKQCEAVEAVKPQECWGSTELQPLEPTGPLEAMELWKAVEAVPLQGSWDSTEPIQEPLETTELREPLLESIELQEPLNATELLEPLEATELIEPLKATKLQEPSERTELQALQRGTELRESREGTELQELWMAVEAAHDLHQSANVQEP